ncbi:MAG: FAD-binding protein [Gammaproteobacteria bacterium]|nr:FAD-binding protein [Gammaproteobacteria bacterium]
MSQPASSMSSVEEQLSNILGNDYVLTDKDSREHYSTDLSFLPHEVAEAVIQPASIDELAKALAVANQAGYAIVPRGGGMSYTQGYSPTQAESVLVDMRRMDNILEINEDDMFVTVECGCTWKKLFEALQEKGLRTPYYGPLSGMYATIGGALSQNSLFLGSGIYNTVAESALGLKVVLADGNIVQTGSAAHTNSNAFYRHFGPDVTGIFTADNGAMGIKAVATLRLIQSPKSTACMSFKFDHLADMLAAQVEMSRLRIASECYGFDPYYNAGFEKQGITFSEGLSLIGKVARKGGLKGVGKAAKMAMGAKTHLKNVLYSLHMTFDALNDVIANEHQEIAAEICLRYNGVEIENNIPTAFRAQPFGGVRTVLLGSSGEIWIPVHGFFPLSKAVAAGAATEKFLADKREILEANEIKTSYLTCFSGTEFIIEPSFYWADELGSFRLSLIEEEFADKWKGIPADLEKRKLVLGLREELRDLYDSLGACHLQIGKYYEYEKLMNNDELWNLLNGIKDVVDPERKMNPGSLGLD